MLILQLKIPESPFGRDPENIEGVQSSGIQEDLSLALLMPLRGLGRYPGVVELALDLCQGAFFLRLLQGRVSEPVQKEHNFNMHAYKSSTDR